MSTVVAWFIITLIVLIVDIPFAALRRRRQDRRDEAQRRVGWAYGYGAGWVDGKHGHYEPDPPTDGRHKDRAGGQS